MVLPIIPEDNNSDPNSNRVSNSHIWTASNITYHTVCVSGSTIDLIAAIAQLIKSIQNLQFILNDGPQNNQRSPNRFLELPNVSFLSFLFFFPFFLNSQTIKSIIDKLENSYHDSTLYRTS